MDRAVIYCRVSTDEETQLNALERQIQEAKASVAVNGWLLVDTYIDEGKSGTTTKNRTQYNRLFANLAGDTFDIVVVKSQDRLMRSSKDWYLFVDRLLKNGKKLYFYLERTFYSTDDGLLTGIKAILAEEYSRDLSKKINNAHRSRQKSKTGAVLITSKTWGYKKVGKDVIVDEEEADIVRLIYTLFAEGYGGYRVGKILAERGIFSRTGKPITSSVLTKMVRNPLFKGTVVMNKRHFNFNTKKTEYLDEDQWVWRENAVPAIVSEELWEKANAVITKNSEATNVRAIMKGKRGSTKGVHPLSQKIICGSCNETYWHTQYKRKDGQQVHVWSCKSYVLNGRRKDDGNIGCSNVNVNREQLDEVLESVAEKSYVQKDKLLSSAVKILREVLQPYDKTKELRIKTQLGKLQERREKLLDSFLDGVLDKEVYRKKDKDLAGEIDVLQQTVMQLESERLINGSLDDRIKLLSEEITKILSKDLMMDFLYRHIEKIIVQPELLTVVYDIFPPTKVERKQINYRKVEYTVIGDDEDSSRDLL